MTIWGESDAGLLHGFVRRDDGPAVRARLRDTQDVRTVLVDEGRLAAMLTLWPGQPDGGPSLAALFADAGQAAALALIHHDVLAAAVAVGDVVPVRLGSVYTTADRVRTLIASDRAVFEAALDGVAGGIELGLRLSVAAPAAAAAPAVQAGGGRGYLRRIADADQARREHRQNVQAFHAGLAGRLGPIARRIVSRPVRQRPDMPPIVSELALLVARGDESRLRHAIACEGETAASLGIALTLTGPWPPYSFAVLPDAAEATA